ncbi:Esterase [Burkholderiales bacterium 8X]|nr:Esterase [Burkholderiales bacterium 8X]
MNLDFNRLMGDATRLTQGGDLQGATELIQRALLGKQDTGASSDAPQDRRWPEDAAAHIAGRKVSPNARDMVLDVESRVVSAGAEPLAADPVSSPRTATETTEPKSEPAAAEPERFVDGSFSHQGRALAYKLFVPARRAGSNESPRGLVVMLHGCTQNAADFAAGTRMNELAAAHDLLVLYPEQAQRANPQRCWNWFKPQHQKRGRGEPAVLAAMTRSIAEAHRVDPARVYIAGLSAGGAMADIMGRAYPDLFAAVGVHSGLPAGAAKDVVSALSVMRSGPQGSSSSSPAAGSGPLPPTIVFHGDADATVHPSNGTAVAGAARGHEDRSAASPPQVTDGRSPRGQSYTRTTYGESTGQAAVEHWRLHGAGHAWAGGSASGSYTDARGVDASAEMLRFFLAHPRRGA